MYTDFRKDIVDSGIMSKVEIIPVGAPLGESRNTVELSDNTNEANVETAVTTPQFTMLAVSFRDMLVGALVAVGKDKTLPALTGLMFDWEPGTSVTVASTDRYRIATGTSSTSAATIAAGTGSMLLPSDFAKELVKTLPKTMVKHGEGFDTVTVALSDESCGEYREATVTVHTASGVAVRTVRLLGGAFPKWRALMPPEDSVGKEGIFTQAYNPAYLADIAKLPQERNAPARLNWTVANKPMLVTFGQSEPNGVKWTYLLMPVRLTN